MRHDAERDATSDALSELTTAVTEFLGQLRAASAPGERAALEAEFAVRVDDLRANIGRRYGLTDAQATTIIARVLAHLREFARAATSRI